MHRSIAAWLSEHPWRAVIASAMCGVLAQVLPPFLVFAAAIPVLITLRHDVRLALGGAIVGAMTTGSGAFVSTEPSVMWISIGFAGVYLAALLLAQLLKRTGSLNLCFQVAVLGAAIVIVAVHASLGDPIGVWVRILNRLLDALASGGFRLEGDRDALITIWARSMWGTTAAMLLMVCFGALMIGRWWQTLLNAPGAFGMEYRKLRLGTTLGVAATIVFVAAYLTESPMLSSLAWVGFCALVFQGLAAAHRSKASGRLNRGWLTAIYVLLVVTPVTAFVLAVWGFADNWLRPRAQSA